ncbi:MAG: rhomboid family intramembrane serine protease [Saprospiraceae bacterium]
MQKDIIAFIKTIRYPLMLIGALWIITLLDKTFDLYLPVLGIYPRELSGLPGIFLAPFIHSTWGHLASNTSPILVLTVIMTIFYPRVAMQAYLMIMVGTGVLVWLFARNSYHIGASGMVYGLVSYVFWTGVFRKNPKSIVLGLIVIILYSGMFASMFPNVEKNISWESHLFGAIVGFVTAFILKNMIETDEINEHQVENKAIVRQFYLSRDTFEMTKRERYLLFLEAERQRMEELKNNLENGN